MLTRLILSVVCGLSALADDFASLCADRLAVERVYYEHRTGAKPPFEETLPRATLEALVRQDLKKETVLRERCGVAISPAQIEAEVQRINTTTRAPEILAEIRAALGNDPAKFANIVAKPIVVERLLRERFDNDDALHLPQRRQAERVRVQLLAARSSGQAVANLVALLKRESANDVSEKTWLLAKRPVQTNSPSADELEIKRRFGPEAQILSTPRPEAAERNGHFEDLPPALRKVLSVQLQQPGDVSAVVEMPESFALFLLEKKTTEAVTLATLFLGKLSYEEWLSGHRAQTP